MIDFFDSDISRTGPQLTEEAVRAAESSLGLRIPLSYVELLQIRNGGRPRRRCFPMSRPTSWAPDHIEVSRLVGIGYADGMDGEFGTAYMVEEWGYPNIGLVVAFTPAGGHDAVMLDYRANGPRGEPCVVYIDDDRTIVPVAETTAAFLEGLVDCSQFASLRNR